MAPEISPPGRLQQKKQRAAGGAESERFDHAEDFGAAGMAGAIDAGIWLTPPYGKSLQGGQMRQRDRSNALAGLALFRYGARREDHFALSAAAFLHSERNFLRSLP